MERGLLSEQGEPLKTVKNLLGDIEVAVQGSEPTVGPDYYFFSFCPMELYATYAYLTPTLQQDIG